MIDQIGNILFKDVYDKFIRRLEACSASYGSSSLLHRIRMINAYALSGLTYIMRVTLFPDKINRIVKQHILKALGTKGAKIGYDRLIVPYREGGYGLIDVSSMNIYMLRTWLPYLKETSLDYFTALIDGWSSFYFIKYNRSPLLSNKRVLIFEELPALDAAWCDYQLVGIDEPSSEHNHLFKLRSANKVLFNDKIFDFNLNFRKKWRITTKLRLTGGQTRWINELKIPLFKLFKVLRSVVVPQYIQFWFFDSLHVILPVLYKRDLCFVCNNPIRSSHFHYDCPGLNVTKKQIMNTQINTRNI